MNCKLENKSIGRQKGVEAGVLLDYFFFDN